MQDLGRRRSGLMFEDIPLGTKWQTGGRTITETDLVNFVNLTWLTEDLFTNMDQRGEHVVAGRPVPGAMVYAMAEGLALPSMEGSGMAFLHMELDVKGPTQVGDTIYVHCEVTEARAVTKPDRGLVRTRNTVVRGDGTPLIIYQPLRLIRRRNPLA